MALQVILTDDADAYAAWDVTDNDGNNVDWASPQIAIGNGTYQSAVFQGSPAPIREIRLSMPNALGMSPGRYSAYLKVPNGPDLVLGGIYVKARA
jgi:hypothetical protein